MQRKFNFLCWSSLQCIVVLAFTRKYTIFSAWKRSQISTWISALENAHKYISSLSLNFGAITHESTGKFERVHRSWSGVRQHTSEMFTGGGAPTVPPAARLATSAPGGSGGSGPVLPAATRSLDASAGAATCWRLLCGKDGEEAPATPPLFSPTRSKSQLHEVLEHEDGKVGVGERPLGEAGRTEVGSFSPTLLGWMFRKIPRRLQSQPERCTGHWKYQFWR